MSIRLTLTALALGVASLTAFAQPAPGASGATAMPRVDQRQVNQQRRIEQGAASGQLTQRETRRLERQQAGVARAEARAKADGKVTAKERKRLARKQNKASRSIARQKHDPQHRAASAPR